MFSRKCEHCRTVVSWPDDFHMLKKKNELQNDIHLRMTLFVCFPGEGWTLLHGRSVTWWFLIMHGPARRCLAQNLNLGTPNLHSRWPSNLPKERHLSWVPEVIQHFGMYKHFNLLCIELPLNTVHCINKFDAQFDLCVRVLNDKPSCQRVAQY